jgi:hypothetical protein
LLVRSSFALRTAEFANHHDIISLECWQLFNTCGMKPSDTEAVGG